MAAIPVSEQVCGDIADIFRGFRLTKLLREDTGTKSVNLLGQIESQDAIIVAEKTAFNTSLEVLQKFQDSSNLSALTLLGGNDIYYWFLASHPHPDIAHRPDIKFTLIYPATEAHIQKYSQQNLRMVTETPQIYQELVKPYVESKRSNGQLNWVYNILSHDSEADIILFEDKDEYEGFILSPDLKWDRKTISAMHMTTLVHRKDITSLRDLKKKDAPWLRRVGKKMVSAICEAYPELQHDQLKLYCHYHPSYYHFHIHAVSIFHDGGLGQSAGKAFLLGNIISQLESMPGEDSGFADIEITYWLGEESVLWQTVFRDIAH